MRPCNAEQVGQFDVGIFHSRYDAGYRGTTLLHHHVSVEYDMKRKGLAEDFLTCHMLGAQVFAELGFQVVGFDFFLLVRFG